MANQYYILSNTMSRSRYSRDDYITQLPPEIITQILTYATKWYIPRSRGRKVALNSSEVAISRALITAVMATCRYFNAVILGSDIMNIKKKAKPDTFVLRSNHAYNHLFQIASRDFIKSLLQPRYVDKISVEVSNLGIITLPHTLELSTELINYIVECGPPDMMIELRRMGLLTDYIYNSASFVVQIDKQPNVCYAARYRLVEDVYDLNRGVEGMPAGVAVRVVCKWIKHNHTHNRLTQSDLNRALNLIIRAHPDHAHQVLNYVSRMRATASVNNTRPGALWDGSYRACRYEIDDNELALYAMYRGETEYSRFLMMRLSPQHRMQVFAMLPLSNDKYAAIMANWDLSINEELITIACQKSNQSLAKFCKEYNTGYGIDNLFRVTIAQPTRIDEIYSQYYCPTRGDCCKPYAKGINTQNDNVRVMTSQNAISTNQVMLFNHSLEPPVYEQYGTTFFGTRCIITPKCTCTGNIASNMDRITSTPYGTWSGIPSSIQPSGTLNFSRVNETLGRYNNDPARKFIRGGSNTQRGPIYGQTITCSIPRYGDLMGYSPPPMTLPPIQMIGDLVAPMTFTANLNGDPTTNMIAYRDDIGFYRSAMS